MLGDNDGSTLNADNSMTRFVSPRWICLLAVTLLFLSGRSANADPVGDFFKKLGQSVSKAFQPQPTPRPSRKTTRASRQATSQESNAAEAAPTPLGAPSKPAKEERSSPAVPASAAPKEKARGDMPYGIPVPGQKGMVTSPYLPEGNYIDVSAFAPGSAVKDPYTGKIFRVP
jgi:hypothetical protein